MNGDSRQNIKLEKKRNCGAFLVLEWSSKTMQSCKKKKLEKNLFGVEKNTSDWKKNNRLGRNMTVGKKMLRV